MSTTPMRQNIVKVSYPNRRLFMYLSLVVSLGGTVSLVVAGSSHGWIYSAERLLHYEPKNMTYFETIPEHERPAFFRNASFGPWKFCVAEAERETVCELINYFPNNPPDPAYSTMAVEASLRKTVYILLLTFTLTFGGSLCVGLSAILQHTNYTVIFAAGVLHVFAGLCNFLFLVVYVSSITQEVLNKLKGETPLDEPLFYYSYGFPFALVIVSFLCVEVVAMLTLSVYMAHHDEKLWNRQRVRKLFRTGLLGGMVGMVGRRRSQRGASNVVLPTMGGGCDDDETASERSKSIDCTIPTGMSRYTMMTDVSGDDLIDDGNELNDDDGEEFVVHHSPSHPRYHSPIDYHLNI